MSASSGLLQTCQADHFVQQYKQTFLFWRLQERRDQCRRKCGIPYTRWKIDRHRQLVSWGKQDWQYTKRCPRQKRHFCRLGLCNRCCSTVEHHMNWEQDPNLLDILPVFENVTSISRASSLCATMWASRLFVLHTLCMRYLALNFRYILMDPESCAWNECVC